MARVKIHPGRMLRAELEVRGMGTNQLALAIRVPANRITATCVASGRSRPKRQCASAAILEPAPRSG